MATIKFLLRSNANPANIHVRVREGRTLDLKTPTNLHVDPKQWIAETGRIKNIQDNKTLIKEVKLLYSSILTLLNTKKDSPVTAKELIEIINPSKKLKSENSIPTGLVAYYEYYIDNLKEQLTLNKVTKSTITKYKVVMKILKRMELHLDETYQVADVDLSFITKFEHFAQEVMLYSPNTIGRAIKFIKTVCRNARINGLSTHLQLDVIQGYTKKTDFIFLNEEELDKIGKVELKQDYLDNARNWLLISCYTGQRVSDFLRFNRSMIISVKAKSGALVEMIEFTQQKTKKIIKLPLSKSLRLILDKNNGSFPRQISDQKYNVYIKEVCKHAGLTDLVEGSKIDIATKRKKTGKYEKWELVTSHIGRRSFASNYYGQIPTPMIMYATGHSTEQMLLKYIGKTNDDNALELAQYLK